MKKHFLLFCLLFALVACANQPLSDDADITADYSHISTTDGRAWDVNFEYNRDTVFTGIVRHTSQWHDSSLPFITHDILVTTGDFSIPKIVNTSVFDHKFFLPLSKHSTGWNDQFAAYISVNRGYI